MPPSPPPPPPPKFWATQIFFGQQEKFGQSQLLMSLISGLAEMSKKYSVLWEISVAVKRLIKKASLALLNSTKSTASFWKPSINVREFSSCVRITLHDCFRIAGDNVETMHENDLVYFLSSVLLAHMMDSYVRIFSLHMKA